MHLFVQIISKLGKNKLLINYLWEKVPSHPINEYKKDWLSQIILVLNWFPLYVENEAFYRISILYFHIFKLIIQ